MKLFLKKLIIVLLVLLGINVVLSVAFLPASVVDDDSYMLEYERKIAILNATKQPRVVFVGGSNIAFGIDSKAIVDSTGWNVVNMGLHAGMGMKFMLKDCLQYVEDGDVVVVQMEYDHFFNGGNGEKETLLGLMEATKWRKFRQMNLYQMLLLSSEIPKRTYNNMRRASLRRESKLPKEKDQDVKPVYRYCASGFNSYGDEESHWYLKSETPHYIRDRWQAGDKNDQRLSWDIMKWLDGMLRQYEAKGVKVLMLPPVMPMTCFNGSYDDVIRQELKKIGRDYIAAPSFMAVDDSCCYNAEYHVTRAGVVQNTKKIIGVLRSHL